MKAKTKLTVPEWRLFLLSNCINDYLALAEYTKQFRTNNKEGILNITEKDAAFIDNFILESDVPVILESLRTEWIFTGRVVDNGKNNYTNCEYCQKQEIRYRYLCVNEITRVWLSVGSICVGNIIHGEDRMRDRKFSKEFIGDLDALKGSSTNIDPSKEEDISKLRKEQHTRIYPFIEDLRKRGYETDEFFISLQTQWKEGKLLTSKQEKSLLEFDELATKYNATNIEIGEAGKVLRNRESRMIYQKVLSRLEKRKTDTFLINCKQMLENSGSLTDNMKNALMGIKK